MVPGADAGISTGLTSIWQGGVSTNPTVAAARDELATLGQDGAAITIVMELAVLLVGLWMFGRGIRSLNRRQRLDEVGDAM